MARLSVIVAPDARLRLKCAPVARVDDYVRRLMDDMLETMYAAPGLGLAAPQVGVTKRVIVVDAAREGEEPRPMRLANPELLWTSEERAPYREGCLSLPDVFVEIERPARVRVRFLDHENEIREVEADGVLAHCLQHEMEHLDGILFIDRLSALRRSIILRRLSKARRQEAAASA